TPVNDSKGLSSSTTLTSANSSYQSIDLGLVNTVSLHDALPIYSNHNGIQDAGEPGVAGVTVTIAGANLPAGYVATQTTDGNGKYQFNYLPLGDYTISFSNLPAGTVATATNAAGSNPANDSNGLSSGTTLTAANPSDQSIDLGLANLPPDLKAVKTDDVSGATTLPNGWTWNIAVSNVGTGAASFTAGQTVLTDNLPASNISYGSASVSGASGITGTVGCAISSNTLTCTATTAVTIAASGAFNVSFLATPSAAGTFANPTSGGTCAVNPQQYANVGETNYANNTCSDTVVVSGSDLKAVKTD